MGQNWDVQTTSGRCAATGQDFGEGDEFYTVLFEEGESFRREDYGLEAWAAPPLNGGPPDGAYCHFKSRVPIKQKRKQLLVNNELIMGFFQRLADDTEPLRVQFRFVLALILMRKRILRYVSTSVEEGQEVWAMTLGRDKVPCSVVNPRLTDAEIEAVSNELSTILHSDMGEWAVADEPAEPPDLGHVPENDDSSPEA